ncbi:uncharacterized protein LOC142977889 isoform X2 [Anticarsia gemmatalis]|uniref:uncharacterized protein LOC142977889 isoform X2 n=1 Tax=Anticarsia gemmatalis TaxID=129554 RepID=UPI003F76C3DA
MYPQTTYGRKTRATKRTPTLAESEQQKAPEPPQKRTTRAMAMAEMRKNAMNPVFSSAAQIPTTYSMTNGMAQGYQHMGPPTSAPPVQQYGHPSYTMPGHAVAGGRTERNRSVTQATTMGPYYNNRFIEPPVAHHGNVQQMHVSAPVASTPSRTETASQTDPAMSEEEIMLIKSIRAKKFDVEKILKILQNNEYIVSLPVSEDRVVPDDKFSSLISISNAFKDQMKCFLPHLRLLADSSKMKIENKNREMPDHSHGVDQDENQASVDAQMHQLGLAALQNTYPHPFG